MEQLRECSRFQGIKAVRKILWVTVFGIAMALVEAAIVVYLRAIYYPDGFSFPLKVIPLQHYIVELGREAATILMLMSVAALCGKQFWERFAHFIVCFGIWDIFYYVWLRVAIAWPTSLFDSDILFLIPLPWIGPVIAPVTISVFMIVIGLFIITLYRNGHEFRPSLLTWVFTITGTLIILYSFMKDLDASIHLQMPLPYRYDLLAAGLVLYAAAFFLAWRNTVKKS
jgi:hypothetical protein